MSQKKIIQLALKAKAASYTLATLSTEKKNVFLRNLADQLHAQQAEILKANAKDVAKAEKQNLNPALIDRLILDHKRIESICDGVRAVAGLDDPVGKVTENFERGLIKVKRVRIPLGVVCMIYESRPNVTIDAAALSFKSGNAVILRGGSEAFETNTALMAIVARVLKKHDLDAATIGMVPFTNRKALTWLLKLNKVIDVVIPRGGSQLMKFIDENTRIPVIKHDKGVCSLFVDETADLDRALNVIRNAKVQRPGVCNALETLYVHDKIAADFLPRLFNDLSPLGVELRGDVKSKKIVREFKKATEDDFAAEYLSLILAIKVVRDVNEAIASVTKYSSNHTDGILTRNQQNAELFVKSVNSSCVTVNSSTRFNDGGELGLGCEIGISTSKLHAYGPMGLTELTTLKYVVEGDYAVRG